MRWMRACACGLVSKAAYNMPSRRMSTVKTGRPSTNLRASTLGRGRPTSWVGGMSGGVSTNGGRGCQPAVACR